MALVSRDDQPDASLLNPKCRECNDKSAPLIHVITHECLEGDALRCVIKAVPDTAPLDEDDYVKVSDLLKWLPGGENEPKPPKHTIAIGGGDQPTFTREPDVPVAITSTDAVTSAATPTVVTITATADDDSTTVTLTTTLGADSSTSAASTATAYADSARMNRIMRPAGSPSHGRIADGRVKDGPMSKLLANHLIQRSEPEESPNPAFSIHDFFTNIVQNKDYAFPRVFHHEHEHHDLDARSREDFKISDDIARVILASDETLNPNSALLHKLRPHLAIEPRAAEYNTEYNTVGPQITALPPHQGNTYIELPAPINFRVEGPFDKAVLALLCVVIAGGIAGVVTLVIRKVKVRGKPFSRV